MGSYSTNDWYKFRMVFEFEEGDINYSGTTDVSDVQTSINLSVNYDFSPSNYCFNLTAGDLMQDGSINVVDVVRTINLVLDSNAASSAPRRAAATDNDEEDAQQPDVFLYVKDGQLMMLSEKPVGAIDLTLSSGGLQQTTWMPGNTSYGATTRDRNGKTRAIICAMNGDSLQIGQTLIADFNQTKISGICISNAIVTDPQGQQLVVAFANSEADGIENIDASAVVAEGSQVYDLSGRQIVNGKSTNRQLRKGLYIVNGKKQVIK
jgi:hypothetical protein